MFAGTDVIFILKQTIEKHREGQNDIRVTFVDIEKAYDRVPREEIWRCMRERNVPETYVKLIQDMYRGCQTKVRSETGKSDSFNVDVGLHQGSTLSPYLFVILMDVLTEGVRKDVPESMMFADDIILCGGREVDMTEYLDTWRKSLEERERGMRVSRPKTQFMDFNFEQNQQGNREPVNILGGGGDWKEFLTSNTSERVLKRKVVWKLRSQSGWEQAGEIGRNATEYCATEGCQ